MSERNGPSSGRHRVSDDAWSDHHGSDVASNGSGANSPGTSAAGTTGSCASEAGATGSGATRAGTAAAGTTCSGTTEAGATEAGTTGAGTTGFGTTGAGSNGSGPNGHGAPVAAADRDRVTRSTHRGTVGALVDSGATALAVPGRTLPIRTELARQLRRRRTQVSFALLALLPVILWAAFLIGGDDDGPDSGPTLVDLASGSGTNFAVFTLFASASFLLVVLVALFFGDTVASEASWSSLRYLLAIPVPRARLLRQKAVVAALLSAGALALLPLVSLLVGSLAYGAGDLVSPVGESLPYWTAVGRVLLGALYLSVHLSWVAGLALLLSVSTDAPLGAVGGAVMASILSQILEQITALGDLRDFLPTHYADAWSALLARDIDWGDMTRGAFSAVVYAVVFATAAAWRLTTKDITS